ncbi:hypothetical protein [Actinacidiphila sp. ITFR-21]|uniref:hypothetical protein n=1 Tax=Actinacidiphila sp. ITFR-21 TaxID=3075199 RepID=UPI00288A607D|nr:hypothetical protein [Streptomyces sp. ITFR-21]WNI19239.1 hypothetical protein RLT57_29290 [Streptomyces sp. ITFR-21]
MISDVLFSKAHGFAAEIQTLLTQTVCGHAQVRAAVMPPTPAGRAFVVGHQVSKANVIPYRLPLRTGTKAPRLWLDVSFRLQMDAEEQYLTVRSSFFGVFPTEDGKDALFHYDYERDKRDNYPDAHLQVAGQDTAMQALLPGKPAIKLHFPVGGKRFRPCLEDVIEFLIREGLAEGKPGHEAVLEAGREGFRIKQLRAAMRRSPEVVQEFIGDHPGLIKG